MKALSNIIWMTLISCSVACAQQTLDEKLESLYHKTVPLIQPEQLADWKNQNAQVFLLDTRTNREFQVSHIAGAELIDYESFHNEDVNHIPKNKKVVVYCSVGYRSERIGEKLQELGFTEVYNLYGGIFQWKNQDHQVVDAKNLPTENVHAYNKSWGQWLEKGVKVYE